MFEDYKTSFDIVEDIQTGLKRGIFRIWHPQLYIEFTMLIRLSHTGARC
jgi:hypothetical protein